MIKYGLERLQVTFCLYNFRLFCVQGTHAFYIQSHMYIQLYSYQCVCVIVCYKNGMMLYTFVLLVTYVVIEQGLLSTVYRLTSLFLMTPL